MKIQVRQLHESWRKKVAHAIEVYCQSILLPDTPLRDEMERLGNAMEHGEVLLCEYTNDEKEGTAL